jgi:hypothetical protein
MNQTVKRLAWAAIVAPVVLHTAYEALGKRVLPGWPEPVVDTLVVSSMLAGAAVLLSSPARRLAHRSGG